jgi:hypothetical protein
VEYAQPAIESIAFSATVIATRQSMAWLHIAKSPPVSPCTAWNSWPVRYPESPFPQLQHGKWQSDQFVVELSHGVLCEQYETSGLNMQGQFRLSLMPKPQHLQK